MTCTCTVEDEGGHSFTLWDGSAFTSQCPQSGDQIVLLHLQFTGRQFTGRQRIECGDRISAVPVSQELNNFTSNATIIASTSNNGSSLTCSAGGPPLVGVMILSVGGGSKVCECMPGIFPWIIVMSRIIQFRNSPCSK